MENILDYTHEELVQWLDKKGIRAFRADQIFKWLYLLQADSFEQMTNLSKPMRQDLGQSFFIGRLELADHQVSADTTEKYLFRLNDGEYVESVLIPEKDHYTLCVSSQVGCAQNCQFCLTAKGGLIRNLSMAEIISQIRDARFFLVQKGMDPLKLSNLVFMGMGEPLANYENLIRSLSVITNSDFGFKFSNKRGDGFHIGTGSRDDSAGPGYRCEPGRVSQCGQ
jgi:23S rRNA (adenine2503-C2)-methyltransferase